MDTAFALQLLVNGLMIGAVYALIASGLSLTFGVIGIVNFAHGELYMVFAMLAYFVAGYLETPFSLSIALVVLTALCVGAVLYEVLLRRLAGKDFERSVLGTMGLAMVLQNGAIFLFTTTPRMVPHTLSYSAYTLGSVAVPVLKLVAASLATVALGLVWWMLHHTQLGRAMRGLSQSHDAAMMVGIDVRAVSRLAVAVGVGLAGLAGAALAPVYSIHPTMGFAFIFKAFAIVTIGGLGNFGGTIVAALMIGMLESFAGTLGSLVMADTLSFAFMILILLFKPEGLFGRGVRI
ncbi:Branched-chain amino acid ABC transporter permease [Hyphomicrobiales bacterium]|nr:Branched-chain amino acid ABC transporter permease [Hyphomicrobiales bacterium]CAH1693637.1 LIV-I protein H [Hyphomicrobiales bacterium]